MPERTFATVSMIGGKAKQARWIINHMPSRLLGYAEPYCGAATVLIHKIPTGVETINDLDGGLIELFRFLRDEDVSALVRSLELTPYSRDEFAVSKQPLTADMSPLERARRLFVRYNQAYGGMGQVMAATSPHTKGGWGVSKKSRSGDSATTTRTWMLRIDRLYKVAARLRQVQIENMPALSFIRSYDNPSTLLYVDPPFHPDSIAGQSAHRMYAYPMTRLDHMLLLEVLIECKSMVLLSGYDNDDYREILVEEHGWDADWMSNIRSTLALKKGKNATRKEGVWMNPALVNAVDDSASPLLLFADMDAASWGIYETDRRDS